MSHRDSHMKDYPIVEVEWVDSCGGSGWRDKDSLKSHHMENCRTVGYLFKADSKEVTLFMSGTDHNDSTDEQCDYRWSIPRKAVKSIKRLLREGDKDVTS